MLTPVMIKPMIAGRTLLPASCPKWTGKIRFPAPKNIPNRVLATIIVSFIVSFVFIVTSLFVILRILLFFVKSFYIIDVLQNVIDGELWTVKN